VCFENERYKQLTISDLEETIKLLEVLEGPAIEPRRQYIYDNATELGFSFD
jgi:DNA gyrase/topoisomerase IV subunit B